MCTLTPNQQIGNLSLPIKKGLLSRFKQPKLFPMKKHLLLLMVSIMAICNFVMAQAPTTVNYIRTSNATASLAPMAGSTQLIGASRTNFSSAVTNIGFDFWFMGVRYTNFSVNSNGGIQLGSTVIPTTNKGSNFMNVANTSVIATFFGYLNTHSTGKVHSVVVGAAPNRKIVIEFLNMGISQSSTTADATFQCALYETTGVIEFTYGGMVVGNTGGTTANRTAVIGFGSNAANTKVLSVTHATPFTVNTTTGYTTVAYTALGAIAGLNSAANGSRKQIIFTPPVMADPTSLITYGFTTTGMTLGWNDMSAGEQGFVIYRSTDGGLTYNFYAQTAANATSYVATGLASGATYFWKVYSVSEGALSAGSANGSAATIPLPCVAPPFQPITLVLTPSTTSIAGIFDEVGTPNGYIIIRTTSATPPNNPANGVNYAAGAFSFALNGFVESVGPSATFNSTGLSPTTQYWYWIFPYNDFLCTGGIQYNTTSPLNGTSTTVPACTNPLAQPTSLVLTPAGTNTINGSFTASVSATSYLVVRTTGAPPTTPVNGTNYFAGTSALGGYIESSSSATTFSSTGLTANTIYFYWVLAYNNTGCAGGPLYLSASPLNGQAYTNCAAATNSPTGLVLTPVLGAISATFTAAGGAVPADGYLVIRTSTATAPSNPVDLVNYTVGTSALGGVVVDVTGATSFYSAGLTVNTQYWYWIFSYKISGCVNGIVYKTSSPLTGNAITPFPACTAPFAQPTALVLTPGTNNITGSFTASASASSYLVIRTTTATAPSNPVNGTNYTVGSTALGGYIESAGAATTFNSNALTPSTQYWYWIYSFNNVACAGGPIYITWSPLTGSATTLACGTITNIAIITAANTATYNWSALPWSLGHIPLPCENVLLELNITTGSSNNTATVNFDVDFTVRNFEFRNSSSSTTNLRHFSTNGGRTIVINGNLFINSPGGYKFNRTTFGNTVSTTINGDVILGRPTPGATDGHAIIGSSSSTPNQLFTIYGDMTFNPRGFTLDEWAIFAFNKAGTQYIYNNTLVTDTVQPVLFENLKIGTTNATTVIMAGTAFDAYIENVRTAGVTIGVNSTLDIPARYSMTKFTGGSAEPFIMLAGAKLRIGGYNSFDRNNAVVGIPGSNFPSVFSPYTFAPTSTVEYYGNNSLPQIIYNLPPYANLIVNNAVGVGAGRAQKNTTGALTVNTKFDIDVNTDVNLGALGSSTATVASAGPLTIANTGGLYCNANVVSGAGVFTMGNNCYLGMGHAQGISPLGSATGNIQMTGGRTYTTSSNYLYNGTVAQITGTGLPTTVNDLTINNPTSVTIANNQLVNGIHHLQQGTFNIGTTQITLNGASVITSTTGKMKADLGTVEMKGTTAATAQNLSGNWFVGKTINTLINANNTGITVASAPADTLLISNAMLYGTATTNSFINTGNNLTLLSRAAGTARFGEIVSGSGNHIAGTVTVERFIPNTRKWRLLSWPTSSSQTAMQSLMENAGTPNANPKSGYGCIVTDEKVSWAAGNFDSRSISGPSLKYYDPTADAFVGIPNTTSYTLNSNNAYFNYVRGDRSSTPAVNTGTNTVLRGTGTLKIGDIVQPVINTKYAAIGNPYASAIDVRKIKTTNTTGELYIWDPQLAGAYGIGAYQVLYKSGTDFNITPGGGSYGPAGSIVDTLESGTGFFVRSNGAGAGNVTFSEDNKTIGARAFSRGAGTAQAEILFALLNIVDPGVNTLVDGSMAAYDDTYSSAVDYDDALKLSNTSENVSFKRSNTLLAIERRKDIIADDTMFINLTGLRVKTYQWDMKLANMENPGRTAFLVDKYTNTTTPLGLNTTTPVLFDVTNIAGSYAADRFMIVFKQLQAPATLFTTISAVRNANKTVKVNWGVANETNIANYTIEQSNNGTTFAAIGTQAAQANNASNPAYSFTDINASATANWYRIKLTSNAGTTSYSAIAMVAALPTETLAQGAASISIYPNPVVNGNINLHLDNQAKGMYSVQVSNKAGQVLKMETVQVQSSNVLSNIKIANPATGSYQVMVIDEAGNKTTIPFIIK
jgi:hypothetical protein